MTTTAQQATDLTCSLIDVQRAARQHALSSEVMRLHFGRMATHTRTPSYPEGLRQAVTRDYSAYCASRITAARSGANHYQIDDAAREGVKEGEADAKSMTRAEAEAFAAMYAES